MLASSAEQLGGRSVTETRNENSENSARNVVTSPENLLTGAAENTEMLVGTRERDLLCSARGEQSIGRQYEVASPSCFNNDFEMTAATSTPARNHKRPRLVKVN